MQASRATTFAPSAFAALGLALAGIGGLGVASGDFAYQWQPVPPEAADRRMLAVAIGLLEVCAGLALVPARTRVAGAWLVAIVMLGWTALHLAPVAARPGSIADWLGLAETGAIAGAVLLAAARAAGASPRREIERLGFAVFGLAALVFGAAHFAYADFTASMIPAWLPARVGLAWLTGAAHAAAGAAIALGVLRLTAALLESAMMLAFVVLVHLPRVAHEPASRMEWTMLLVAVMLCASAALVAAVQRRHAPGAR